MATLGSKVDGEDDEDDGDAVDEDSEVAFTVDFTGEAVEDGCTQDDEDGEYCLRNFRISITSSCSR